MQHDSSKLLLYSWTWPVRFYSVLRARPRQSRGDLDLLGVLVLAFSTALAGGIIRDLLIGDVPPRPRCVIGATPQSLLRAELLAFVSHRAVPGNPSKFHDGARCSRTRPSCAVAGTEKALLHKMHPFIAVLLGTITAVGGGTLRDMFPAHRSPRSCALMHTLPQPSPEP